MEMFYTLRRCKQSGESIMKEDRLNCVLSLMFQTIKIPMPAKEKLKRQLFGAVELSDDDMGYVEAAGEAASQKDENDQNNPLTHGNNN